MTVTPSEQAKTIIPLSAIHQAKSRLKNIAIHTPLQYNAALSKEYDCELYLKREDLQVVRSYKVRGAYNMMSQLNEKQTSKGIVCASAGNHAQGVAFACAALDIHGSIYMPSTTPQQKIKKVRQFGGSQIEIILVGDTFDDAYAEAIRHGKKTGKTFVHPFNDPDIIAGQGTVGLEIIEDLSDMPEVVLMPVGGGGLSAGVGSYISQVSPNTEFIGLEPEGAPAMQQAIRAGEPITLKHIDKFVDGAAVMRVGEVTLGICKSLLSDIILVPEGKICTTILQLYNEFAIVVEPAGALSIAALDFVRDRIKGKRVVCIISGGNNDIARTEEITERSLIYQGLKHYFIIRFPQRTGAFRDFLNNVLGPTDVISTFQYTKKTNRDSGPALVAIELEKAADYPPLLERMKEHGVKYEYLNDNPMLFDLFV